MIRVLVTIAVLLMFVPWFPGVDANHSRPYNDWQYGTTEYCEDELVLWAVPMTHAQPYVVVDPGTRFQADLRYPEQVDDNNAWVKLVVTFYTSSGSALDDKWGNVGIEAQTPPDARYATVCVLESPDELMEPTPVGVPMTGVDWKYHDGYVG